MASPKRGSLMDLPKRVELARLESTRSVEELERTFLAESGNVRADSQVAGQSIERAGEQPVGEIKMQPSSRQTGRAADQADGRTNVEPNVRTDAYTPAHSSDQPPSAIESAGISAGREKEPSPDSLAARIRREPRSAVKIVGYKIPEDLKEELEVVARYNNSDMTRIVVEGIRLALSQLPHPPDWRRR